MIYQIIDSDTGFIVKTLTAPTTDIARMYLAPGQRLLEGGPLVFERKRLIVQNGVIEQIPYVGPGLDEPLLGEGLALKDVTHADAQ